MYRTLTRIEVVSLWIWEATKKNIAEKKGRCLMWRLIDDFEMIDTSIQLCYSSHLPYNTFYLFIQHVFFIIKIWKSLFLSFFIFADLNFEWEEGSICWFYENKKNANVTNVFILNTFTTVYRVHSIAKKKSNKITYERLYGLFL